VQSLQFAGIAIAVASLIHGMVTKIQTELKLIRIDFVIRGQ